MTPKTKNLYLSFFWHIFEHFENSIFTFTGVLLAWYFFPVNEQTWLGQNGIYIAISAMFFTDVPGAIFFSWIGDKYGRKPALMLAYALFSISSLMIILIPSYAAIGILSSILIVGVRLLQGFCLGGSFFGRVILMSETESKNKYFWLGILISLGFFGSLLGTGLSAWCSTFDTIPWAWKIPYIFVAIMGTFLFFHRKHVLESPEWLRESSQKISTRSPFLECYKRYKKEMWIVFLFGSAYLLPFYIGIIWGARFLEQNFGFSSTVLLQNTSYLMFLSGISVIFFFWLSTYVNPFYFMVVGIITTVFLAILFHHAIDTKIVSLITLSQTLIALQVGLFVAPVLLYSQYMFPVKYRFSGFSVPLALGKMLITGTAPLIAATIVEKTQNAYLVGDLLYFTAGAFLVATFLVWRFGYKGLLTSS